MMRKLLFVVLFGELIVLGVLSTNRLRKGLDFRMDSEFTEIELNNDTSREARLQDIVKQIAMYETIDGASVGYAARESDQYRRYKWLRDNTHEQELISLTSHPSVNVRVYSFDALCERDSKLCREIFERGMNDRSKFQLFAGCIQSEEYINTYWYRCLEPRLSKDERKRYKDMRPTDFDDPMLTYLKGITSKQD
jgi:hypothetical protein